MIRSFLFLARLLVAWGLLSFFPMVFVTDVLGVRIEPLFAVLFVGLMAMVAVAAISHIRRVRLVAGHVNGGTLSNRQRRQIEIPFEAGEAFDLLAAAIRELPGVEEVHTARDSLQVRARLQRIDPYGGQPRFSPDRWLRVVRNQILATVTPNADAGSVLLICEPEAGAWSDLFRVDDGTNLENAEAIARAITRRVAERRRGEKADVAQTVTEKELTAAKLSLLHAQVEPHFLYNTLASAQYLTRSDPARADEMLGNLITYLRHSLPRTDGGTVWILAKEAEGQVAVTVADDGQGLGGSTRGGTGIGLRNVRERLRLAYGAEANLSVVANFPNGVAATITVPAEGAPEVA